MRSVHKFILIVGLGGFAGCGEGGRPSVPPPAAHPSTVFHAHFSGNDRLVIDSNATPWVAMSELPTSQRLGRQTIEKLSRTPYQFCRYRIATTNDYAWVFQELITDLLHAESFVEITGDSNRFAEGVLAVRLPAKRVEFWRTNLLGVLESWTGCRGELLAGGAGWQLTKPHATTRFRFIHSGEWTLVGCGNDSQPLQSEYLQRIQQAGNPALAVGNAWLEVFCDGPNLPPAASFARSENSIRRGNLLSDLPAASFALVGRDSNLRLKGELTFREPFAWQPEPWWIPTNLIRDPLVSFTAIQGFSSIFHRYLESFGLQLARSPHQLFVWAGNQSPFQTWAAALTEDSAEHLNDIAPQLIGRFNPALNTYDLGGLLMTTNAMGVGNLRWVGIPPFVTPFISASRDAGRDYLLAGLHPNRADSNAPPPDVMLQYVTSRTNLLYYEWEITAERAWGWRNTINVFRHFFEMPRLPPDSASIAWLNSISNHLGNTVSEITQSSSNRLVFTRQGPIGLTGLELIALAHWLESPEFPLNGFAISPRTTNTNTPHAR